MHYPATVAKAKITAGGQISLPAAIRRRWGVGELDLIDLGDHVVLRPSVDPIDAAYGALAGRIPPTDELRRLAREDEAAAEQRRAPDLF